MDKELKRNLRLGFLVLLGLALLIAGIFAIGTKEDMFAKSVRVSTVFNNATGLRKGNYVRYNGVKVGVVENVILINDTVVQVDMQIRDESHRFIKQNARAVIASDGLMGDKLINIVPGNGAAEMVAVNGIIAGSNPINLDDITKTLDETNNNVRVITENLKNLSNDLVASHGTFNALVTDTTMPINLRQSLKNLNTLTTKLNDAGSSLQLVLSDVRTGNNSIGSILQDTALASNLESSIAQIKAASDKLLQVSNELSQTTQSINAGSGVATRLLTDTALANDVNQSVVNIRDASEALNQNMEALKHSFLLRGYFRKQAKQNLTQ